MSDFVGQKVKLKVKTKKLDLHELGIREYKSYELDDPEMVTKLKETFGENVRIFPPGTCGTMDFQQWRTNVYIDKNGIITEVNNG